MAGGAGGSGRVEDVEVGWVDGLGDGHGCGAHVFGGRDGIVVGGVHVVFLHVGRIRGGKPAWELQVRRHPSPKGRDVRVGNGV